MVPEISAEELQVSPDSVLLTSPEVSQQMLVTKTLADGRKRDVTRQVEFRLSDDDVASVDSRGLIKPKKDGKTKLIATLDGQTVSVPVVLRGVENPHPVSFRNEIIPILTKASCNSGGCHGKAEGQNGFKLSVFGFDPKTDHQALTMESRGRRVLLSSPERSLLYLKGSARMPHGGGQKIDPGGYRDRRLLRWIQEGARFETSSDETGRIVGIEIEPRQQILLANEMQQIRVTAVDAQGNRQCVTTEAEYESN
ncbi:MAG: Ig-like domain-containing protein, partial [Planctomycetaceae bacterium]|nr:Ig-like domain-containing protein [Planctomycetaceae bacterium]